MKVILLKDVAKVGRAYEIKEVSPGFAMNMLLPRGLAEKATPEKIQVLSQKIKEREEQNKNSKDKLSDSIKKLGGQKIMITAKANEQGHLYKEIHLSEIVEAIKDQLTLDIPEDSLQVNSHFKEIGEFDIEAIGAGEKATLKLEIKSV